MQDPALKDSLTSLDRKLAASAGGGPPDDLDIIYTTVRDDRTVRETLNGVQTRLLYVMMLLQAADAQPTDAQKTAAREGEQVVRSIHSQWDAFKAGAIREMNLALEKQQHEVLKIEEEH